MTLENVVGTCPYVYTDDVFYGFLATHQVSAVADAFSFFLKSVTL